jgi:hypothetical protein
MLMQPIGSSLSTVELMLMQPIGSSLGFDDIPGDDARGSELFLCGQNYGATKKRMMLMAHGAP